MAVNVHSTNGSSQHWSRHEMLQWVNTQMMSEFQKIEELCTGAAYCQFMDMLFPNSVSIKRIKFRANQEHEFMHNFKILQASFQKNSVHKEIPIERLIKGRFQDNFEFLQWFRKFFNANYKGNAYNAIVIREGIPMGFGPNSVHKSPLNSARSFNSAQQMRARSFVSDTHLAYRKPKVKVEVEVPKKQLNVGFVQQELDRVERDCDQQVSKLRDVKAICEKNFDKNPEVVMKILNIINGPYDKRLSYTVEKSNVGDLYKDSEHTGRQC